MNTQENKKKLIMILKTHTNRTSKDLSSLLNLSPRSVKYLVSEINKEAPNTILSSSRGYHLNESVNVDKFIQGNNIPSNYEERKRFIFQAIILDKQKLTIDELAQQLCISVTTLHNEVTKLRNELSTFNLTVRIKNNIISISGLDKGRRKALLSMINDEIKNSYFSLENIQKIFTTVNVKEVQSIVCDILNQYSYYLDDYSLLNFVLHIALTIELRGEKEISKINQGMKTENIFNQIASPHVIRMVNDLYLQLKNKYNTNYDINDIHQASILMITRIRSDKTDMINYKQIEKSFGKSISHLLNEIIEKVEGNYSINLHDEKFLVRFAFHLKNLILRLQKNIPITNLQFGQIKNEYPLIYAISVYIAKIIQEETNLIMPEDEIAYIALHIGILMEENNASSNKLKCLIVASNYNELGLKISKKISQIFSESILVSDVVTQEPKKEDLHNIDLVISTKPIQTFDVPNYTVAPFVSENDIKELFMVIDEINNHRIKNDFKKKILYFFKSNIFFYNQPYKNSHDAIEAMCDELKKKHYVEDGFKESIYEHETIAPSSYGRIAISHPLNIDAKKSFIAVSLNPTPIRWGVNQVNIVFMLSLRSDDRELFTDIFEYIVHIFKNDDAIKKILCIDNFNDFVNFLVSMY